MEIQRVIVEQKGSKWDQLFKTSVLYLHKQHTRRHTCTHMHRLAYKLAPQIRVSPNRSSTSEQMDAVLFVSWFI